MTPDLDLDRFLASVMGWAVVALDEPFPSSQTGYPFLRQYSDGFMVFRNADHRGANWSPSTSIANAMEVAERVRPDEWIIGLVRWGGRWHSHVRNRLYVEELAHEHDAKPAPALSRAIRAAVEAQRKDTP